MHDQRVFRLSEVQEWLGNPEEFPEDCHILGDAAYKLHQNVIVPYRDNGHLTARQKTSISVIPQEELQLKELLGFLKQDFAA